MQKKKLSIKNLKVTSFVTENDKEVKGGREAITIKTTTEPTPMTWCYWCPPDEILY